MVTAYGFRAADFAVQVVLYDFGARPWADQSQAETPGFDFIWILGCDSSGQIDVPGVGPVLFQQLRRFNISGCLNLVAQRNGYVHAVVRFDAREAYAHSSQALRAFIYAADVIEHDAGGIVAVGIGKDVVFD